MVEETIKFAEVTMHQSRVFYKRNHVFATVLHNKICEGHILLAPIQNIRNIKDMKNQQMFELVLAIKELSQIAREFDKKVGAEDFAEDPNGGVSVVI